MDLDIRRCSSNLSKTKEREREEKAWLIKYTEWQREREGEKKRKNTKGYSQVRRRLTKKDDKNISTVNEFW